jgi:predicted nucleotidyltransferase
MRACWHSFPRLDRDNDPIGPHKIPEALPAEVRAWLSPSSQALIDSLGEDLEALILFGSAAEGLMRASSDVNLLAMLDSLPLERVSSVHLSGGHWETALDGRSRLIDDHIHDPPAAVYELLEVLGFRARQPLTVIIERDGHYPDFAALLEQIARARAALALGRERRREIESRQVA